MLVFVQYTQNDEHTRREITGLDNLHEFGAVLQSLQNQIITVEILEQDILEIEFTPNNPDVELLCGILYWIRAARMQYHLSGTAGGEPFNGQLYELIRRTIIGGNNINAVTRRFELACSFVATFSEDAEQDILTDKVYQRLKEVNVNISKKQVLQQIKKQRAKSNQLQPHIIAERFLSRLYLEAMQSENCDLPPRDEMQYLCLTDQNDFFLYNGKVFEFVQKREMSDKLMKVIQSMRIGDERIDSNGSTRLLSDAMNELRGYSTLDTTTNTVPKVLPYYMNEGQGEDRNYIVFNNGILDLDKYLQEGPESALIPHTPNWVDTCLIPFDYDPLAVCPVWNGVLNRLFQKDKDDSRLKVLQEAFGMCIARKINFNTKAAIWIRGNRDIGKSVIVKVIRELVGPENVSYCMLNQFGDKFDRSEMLHKRVNIHDDITSSIAVAEGVFKNLVDGVGVSCQQKFRQPEQLIPPKLIFVSNPRISIHDPSGAVLNRLLYFDFWDLPSIENPDRELFERLKEELPGILNWALEGLTRLIGQGKFTVSMRMEEDKKTYKTMMSELDLFVVERIVVDEDSGVYTEALFKEWKIWSDAGGSGTTKGKGRRKLTEEICDYFNRQVEYDNTNSNKPFIRGIYVVDVHGNVATGSVPGFIRNEQEERKRKEYYESHCVISEFSSCCGGSQN